MQAIVEQFRNQVLAAVEAGTPLRVRGGGSKDWYGNAAMDPAAPGALLDTRAYTGVVDYEPTELVITVRCGTPLAEVEALLAANGQMLAFEPPRLGAGSTIGGVVASGLAGPRRASAGGVRDFVLGAKLMDGKGEVLNFGGQVMKNVAGYDVSRLLAGSMGTLGLILEVSLKVLPLPVCEAALRFELGEIDALRRLNEWAGQPLPLSASCWHRGVLTLRLSGAEAAVRAALARMDGARVPDGEAAAFWASLRDQSHGHFNGGALWRLSVPPAASSIILKGEQLIEWGGAQRWLKVDAAPTADTAQDVRRTVAAAGGHATLFRADDKRAGAFHPPASAVAKINQRLKQAFDPAGIFNPGRM
ncbi:glycolate oxidase [Massilia sp. Root351]|jgi:glycolate oxidase FAD binding subunit|uniref:glycolate oxidase subunit GlcE n=1 Tax=Massilia sp. Root351 TaxID=1736522 RepID=UPI00070A8FE2|nr:glycolate oxidase subunit GlcE [Massilia sp. Root351]KQV91047.1 glycolate oxidase [Massilia sp. Root351]